MPQAFDFLIDGELLRTPVEQFLLTKGITPVSLSAVAGHIVLVLRSFLAGAQTFPIFLL